MIKLRKFAKTKKFVSKENFHKEESKSKVSEIPEGWKIVKLKHIVIEMKDGGTPSRKNSEHFGGDINWAVVEDIQPEIWKTSEKLTELGLQNSSAKVWPVESIVISLGASIGHVGIAKKPTATKQGLCGIIVDKNKIMPSFLAEVLRNKKKLIERLSSGSTIKEVRPSTLKTILTFQLPPLKEQEKITEILSTVDQAIEETDNIIKATERMKKGLMKKIFREGLLKENLKRTEIGMIPERWNVMKLEQVVIEMKDGGTPSTKNSEHFGGDINWAVVEDIQPEIRETSEKLTDLGLKNSSAKVWPEDSIIISLGASIGHVGILKKPAATKQGLCGIVPDKEKIVPLFLAEFLRNKKKFIQRLSQGSTIKEIRPVTLGRMFKLGLPSLKEQKDIVGILSALNKQTKYNKIKFNMLKKLKKSLMQNLLSGKRRVKC